MLLTTFFRRYFSPSHNTLQTGSKLIVISAGGSFNYCPSRRFLNVSLRQPPDKVESDTRLTLRLLHSRRNVSVVVVVCYCVCIAESRARWNEPWVFSGYAAVALCFVLCMAGLIRLPHKLCPGRCNPQSNFTTWKKETLFAPTETFSLRCPMPARASYIQQNNLSEKNNN